MWQTFLDVLWFVLCVDFFLGAAFGTALFFYLWYQELRTDPGRWPKFASDTEFVVLCAMCFVPVINIVFMFIAIFLVAMTWDLEPPSRRRQI